MQVPEKKCDESHRPDGNGDKEAKSHFLIKEEFPVTILHIQTGLDFEFRKWIGERSEKDDDRYPKGKRFSESNRHVKL